MKRLKLGMIGLLPWAYACGSLSDGGVVIGADDTGGSGGSTTTESLSTDGFGGNTTTSTTNTSSTDTETTSSTSTSTTTQTSNCGNGVLEEAEECDDGNTTNYDGCSDACLLESCIDSYPGGTGTVIASNQGSPGKLILGGEYIYWLNGADDEFIRQPKGGSPEVFLSAANFPTQSDAFQAMANFEIVGSDIYFIGGSVQQSVWKTDLAVSSLSKLNEGDSGYGSYALYVGNDNAYWAPMLAPFYVSLSGGAASLLTTEWNSYREVMQMAGDENYLYWVEWENSISPDPQPLSVVKAPANGGEAITVAELEDGAYPLNLVGDATHIYWTNNMSGVYRSAKDGSGQVEQISTSPGAWAITEDDNDWIYYSAWEEEEYCYRIEKVAKQGGTPVVLATGHGLPWTLAAQENSLYWTDLSDGEVIRLDF